MLLIWSELTLNLLASFIESNLLNFVLLFKKRIAGIKRCRGNKKGSYAAIKDRMLWSSLWRHNRCLLLLPQFDYEHHIGPCLSGTVDLRIWSNLSPSNLLRLLRCVCSPGDRDKRSRKCLETERATYERAPTIQPQHDFVWYLNLIHSISNCDRAFWRSIENCQVRCSSNSYLLVDNSRPFA